MVATREHRLLRLALAWNAAALLSLSALVGGWVRGILGETLPPFSNHVLVGGGRLAGQATFNAEDRAFVSGLPGVVALHPRMSRVDSIRPDLGRPQAPVPARIHSTSTAWPRLAGYRLVSGRMWSMGEQLGAAPVALVSGTWERPPTSVTIGGLTLRVLGVLDGPGEFEGPSRSVWVPLVNDDDAGNRSYLIEVDGQENRDRRVATDIDRWMRTRHGVTAAGQSPVSITTFAEARSDMALVRRALFLGLIAFFLIPSIFVGAGVAAVTRLAIHQRIPEIGLRRAVGATRQQVLDLFVGEALALAWGATWRACLLGALGLAIGNAVGLALAPPVAMIVLALILPSFICFAFSVPPAVAAAELQPATALGVR